MNQGIARHDSREPEAEQQRGGGEAPVAGREREREQHRRHGRGSDQEGTDGSDAIREDSEADPAHERRQEQDGQALSHPARRCIPGRSRG